MKKNVGKIYRQFCFDKDHVLVNGDCVPFLSRIPSKSIDLVVTSPPYFMGKDYDKSVKVEDFVNFHRKILPEIFRITKDGGSICWQVGYHVKMSQVVPLDYLIYEIFSDFSDLYLRNRIIWTFGHGLHGQKRFSGRHEMILWFTKGKNYYFDLDSIRIPQKYPGKRYYKGDKKGMFSGNPLGKNPSDVWDIPNVKAKHIEKSEHPCQYPIALAQRLIKALVPPKGKVLDPFIGSGTTAIAAILESKKFLGFEIEKKYHNVAVTRCHEALENRIKFRPLEREVLKPNPSQSVARKPAYFR